MIERGVQILGFMCVDLYLQVLHCMPRFCKVVPPPSLLPRERVVNDCVLETRLMVSVLYSMSQQTPNILNCAINFVSTIRTMTHSNFPIISGVTGNPEVKSVCPAMMAKYI